MLKFGLIIFLYQTLATDEGKSFHICPSVSMQQLIHIEIMEQLAASSAPTRFQNGTY